jgi:predicted CXXCH cytochrome family protein
MRRSNRVLVVTGLVGAAAICGGQSQSVIYTPHNLSASGPGAVRASGEDEVCVFCHTPHNSAPVQPLWNRSSSTSLYTVYRSDSLKSEPGQPTGSSKLCLSCHDGTIALGSVTSRNQVIHMSGGITTLPAGRTNLGTDLSDDHPISFRYDSVLVNKNPKLADPGSLPAALRLDHNRELQCTTCHDAHNNTHGSFLTMSNENAAMCRSCHTMSAGTHGGGSSHTDCASCHQPHTAPSGPHLLTGQRVSVTCLSCHDGSRAGGGANVAADLRKISAHPTESRPSFMQGPGTFSGHATCADCHEPHTMAPATGIARGPEVSPTMGTLRGVSASGAMLTRATMEYEVCFRCHGDQNTVGAPTIKRQVPQTNMRLMFSTAAASAHPLQGGGRRGNSPSLRAPWTSASVLTCTDCHGSDTSKRAGGTGPDGLHGSNERPLLLARYETADFTIESPSAYALCYRCHDRDGPDGILQDRSFKYHRLHIVDQRTPCSVCHDSHGISGTQGSHVNHAGLINFDISVVSPDPVTGRLEFRKTGTFSGSCALSCHGSSHSPKEY